MDCDFSRVSREDLAYMAGIVDGEGTITLANVRRISSHEARIIVSNTNTELLYWIQARFGGLIRDSCRSNAAMRRHHKANHKPLYYWSLRSKRAYDLVMLLREFLVIKARQAEVVIRYQGTRLAAPDRWNGLTPAVVEQRNLLKAEMLELNRRGIH